MLDSSPTRVSAPTLNISASVAVGNKKPGANILISLSGRIEGDRILITSGATAGPSPTAPVCNDMLIGASVSTPAGELVLISTTTLFPAAAVVELAGVRYTVPGFGSASFPGGELSASGITFLGARICLLINAPPPPVQPPVPEPAPPIVGLPPPPVIIECPFPAISLNLWEYLGELSKYMTCRISNIVAQVSWIVSALGSLIPQVLGAIVYFLSLAWIDELIKRLIGALDQWIDNVIDRVLDKLFKEWP